jgi:ACS family hexuronate transporter-like MFS transporter
MAPAAATSAITASDSEAATTISRAGYFRWVICALLLFGTTKNYMDRQVLGVLKTTLQHDLGWNEIDYGNVVFWFQVAYAGGYLFAGRLMDRVGLRIGYTVAIALWSVAAMSHAFARTAGQFAAARFGLGLAEGGNFPAAIKTVSEWFPKKERAFATGLFNAGCNIGAVLTMPNGRQAPKSRFVLIYVLDLVDHYSQMANYMRLNGMLPPSALPRPAARPGN